MKVCILGVSGMLGHQVFNYFSKLNNYDVFAISTSEYDFLKQKMPLLDKKKFFFSKDSNYNNYKKILINISPDLLINCTGILKEKKFFLSPYNSIFVNSLLPHILSELSKKFEFKLISFSTDILYNNNNNNKIETSEININSKYSASKFLGEIVDNSNSITLRTSIIGHNLFYDNGLVDWFITKKDKVSGYNKVLYSGFTTIEISRIIEKFIIKNKKLSGVYNLSSIPISKFDLLSKIKNIYSLNDVSLIKNVSIVSNRILNSNKFNSESLYIPPSWDLMINEMFNCYNENKFYKK